MCGRCYRIDLQSLGWDPMDRYLASSMGRLRLIGLKKLGQPRTMGAARQAERT